MNHTNLHPMRRPDRAASEDFARRTANEAPYGTLVTASASGEPYGTPVSPTFTRRQVQVESSRTSPQTRAARWCSSA